MKPRLQAGGTPGGYRIVDELGTGGMATVYRAYQPDPGRYVALKVLRTPGETDSPAARRFRAEMRVTAALKHPNIVPVYDAGELNGRPFIAVQLVEGKTLAAYLAGGRILPLAAAVAILGQIGRALDYAHARGVVHRDVKPLNILMDAQGHAYLTDFGIAYIVGTEPRITRKGFIVGTPAYMAPERVRDEGILPATDRYALGVIAYQMLAGIPPGGSPASAMAATFGGGVALAYVTGQV